MTPRRIIARLPIRPPGERAPGIGVTISPMPSRGTPPRTIRVADELWIPFTALAKKLGETPSQIVREAIRGYLGTHGGTWSRALRVAEERGDDLNEVVRQFLQDYIDRA